MTKVYLSSTLLDLKEERQAVTDWLVAAGVQPVHSDVADTERQRSLIVNHDTQGEAGDDQANFAEAPGIAATLQAKGTLAPRGARVIDDLKRRVSE